MPQTTNWWRSCREVQFILRRVARILEHSIVDLSMGSASLQSESQPPATSRPQEPWEPFRLCGTIPTTVVPPERYVEQLWTALDQTLHHSKCGFGPDTPVGWGGTLRDDFAIEGATAPGRKRENPPGVPPSPEYLPEMKDAEIVQNVIQALSPRIVAVHGPTGTGNPPCFHLQLHIGLRRLRDYRSV